MLIPRDHDFAKRRADLRNSEYLVEDVTLVISGDNPVTVSHIAHQAGFADYQSYIDCSKVSDESWRVAEDTAILAVYLRERKVVISNPYANGHTTAMTGDGVNIGTA